MHLAIHANMYVAIRVVAHSVNIPGCVVVSLLVPANPVPAIGCRGALSVLVADGWLDEFHCGLLMRVVAPLLLRSSNLSVSCIKDIISLLVKGSPVSESCSAGIGS